MYPFQNVVSIIVSVVNIYQIIPFKMFLDFFQET